MHPLSLTKRLRCAGKWTSVSPWPTATSYQVMFLNVTRWTMTNQTHVEEYNSTEHYNITTVSHTRRNVSASLPGVTITVGRCRLILSNPR